MLLSTQRQVLINLLHNLFILFMLLQHDFHLRLHHFQLRHHLLVQLLKVSVHGNFGHPLLHTLQLCFGLVLTLFQVFFNLVFE